MSKPFPPNPSLENLKKQAKSLLKGFQTGAPEALERVRKFHPRLRDAAETELQNAKFSKGCPTGHCLRTRMHDLGKLNGWKLVTCF